MGDEAAARDHSAASAARAESNATDALSFYRQMAREGRASLIGQQRTVGSRRIRPTPIVNSVTKGSQAERKDKRIL